MMSVRSFVAVVFVLILSSGIPVPLSGEDADSKIEIDAIKRIQIPRQAEASTTFRFREDTDAAQWLAELRLTQLGDPKQTRDVLFLFHGDTPNYYVQYGGGNAASITADFSKLHQVLSSIHEGLLVIQPLSAERDWHSLYREAPRDSRATTIITLLHEVYDQCRLQLPGKKGALHLHSFSGAGRIDRAWHEYFSVEGRRGQRGRALLKDELKSWTASDAMVNNSFSNADKEKFGSVLAASWAGFLHRNPDLPVTFIYDREGEYSYMQGVNLDVLRYTEDLRTKGKIVSEPSVGFVKSGDYLRSINKDQTAVLAELAKREGRSGVITLDKADGHIHTFLGKIADAYLNHNIHRKTTKR